MKQINFARAPPLRLYYPFSKLTFLEEDFTTAKVKYKIAAAVIGAASASVFAIGVASATKESTNGFALFDLSLPDKGIIKYTDYIQKDDYYDYAVVYFDEGYPTCTAHFRVQDESGRIVSEDGTASSSGRYAVTYNSGYGIYGDYYRLSMNGEYYGGRAVGRWAP